MQHKQPQNASAVYQTLSPTIESNEIWLCQKVTKDHHNWRLNPDQLQQNEIAQHDEKRRHFAEVQAPPKLVGRSPIRERIWQTTGIDPLANQFYRLLSNAHQQHRPAESAQQNAEFARRFRKSYFSLKCASGVHKNDQWQPRPF